MSTFLYTVELIVMREFSFALKEFKRKDLYAKQFILTNENAKLREFFSFFLKVS